MRGSKFNVWRILWVALVLFSLAGCEARSSPPIHAVKITEGLDHPWSMVFLPDDDEILVTERPGRLRSIKNGKLVAEPVSGLPAISEIGQGGLLGLVLHPHFARNRWLYFSYAGKGEGGYSTEVARGHYQDGRLSDVEVIFVATPKVESGHHFGGRLGFDRSGYLYLTLGDRGERDLAQDTSNHAGSLIRIRDDGQIPASNPLVGQQGADPAIFSFGHRNMQGLAFNPATGAVWTHEHGPQGGDEINIIKPGGNYGWPLITYGEEYGGGAVGEGKQEASGLQPPLYYWVPSIAPSGMTFYTGDRYPGWKGSLLVGSLKFEILVRLTLLGNKVAAEERMLEGEIGRIRDVQQGPDDLVYLLTDEANGGLYRLDTAQ